MATAWAWRSFLVVTAEGVLAVYRSRPYGSVVFGPDGSGTIWTDEVRFERTGKGSMDAMALIGPNTVLVTYIDSMSREEAGLVSRVTGLPVTVRRRQAL